MTNFLTNVTTTENGQTAFNSTLIPVLDFFYKVGSSRGKDLTTDFINAFEADLNLSARALLWSRDIREGAGEREHFRTLVPILMKKLKESSFLDCEKSHPDEVLNFITKIPVMGRFDDLECLFGTEFEQDAVKVWTKAIADKNALAAKWAPRKDKKGAKPLRKALNMTEKRWRQLLALLSDTVEQKLCADKLEEINYNHLPSLAAKRYTKAFLSKDAERYQEYLDGLKTGESKVNAGAVYPYQVIKALSSNEELAEAMWKALPDWDFGKGTLPMIDVSTSMEEKVAGNVSAMDIAISLGLYASERCTGAFKDTFMTFESQPSIVDLSNCDTLYKKVNTTERASWGGSTNFEAAYRKLLEYAVMQGVTQEDMPTRLLIVSDMQFDVAQGKSHWGNWLQQDSSGLLTTTTMEQIRAEFAKYGYKAPDIIFWQVNYRDGGIPITKHETGAALISGFSPSIIRAVMTDELDPVKAMLTILMEDRYAV